MQSIFPLFVIFFLLLFYKYTYTDLLLLGSGCQDQNRIVNAIAMQQILTYGLFLSPETEKHAHEFPELMLRN